ncbi:protein of unknown function [Noviherbaspirillum humi]|uniref:DUF1854 domain-containing protein n=1 Tax=Noviherbaspirillum humi TaxID=1688639 RepID=A0A239JZW9_9BURK|nr:DUF1854 domain-containing protein [Noviherbaspirillum humi]SNT11626.1 protein of unknown function [Noviherbaspirillum humi]
MSATLSFELKRDAFGRLAFLGEDGQWHGGVVPVRAFPIAAPDHGISLMDADGHELVWIESLQQVPADARRLIEEELAGREFLPVISRIDSVSSFATPSTWQVETDRGATSFVLEGEENIRRIGQSALLIADSHGIQFLIRDLTALDRHSRKLLDRFL